MVVRLAAENGMSDKDLLAATDFLVVALPGIGSDYDRLYTQLALNYIGWTRTDDLYVVDDTDCGLYGGGLSNHGICAIANTGSSVLAVTENGDRHKFDGWGAVIGDLGSGFDVAQKLFHILSREKDVGPIPNIFYELKHHLCQRGFKYVHCPADLQLWFDNICRDEPTEWRSTFGEVASVVTAAAKRSEPDQIAELILKQAASRMAETIMSAVSRFPSLKGASVYCQGGMFEFSPAYRDAVFLQVSKSDGPQIRLGSYRPITGALLLSLSRGNGMPSPDKVGALLAAIGRTKEAATVFRPDLRELLDV